MGGILISIAFIQPGVLKSGKNVEGRRSPHMVGRLDGAAGKGMQIKEDR